MNVKEQLRSNFPNTFNKTAKFFSALVANDKGTAVMENLLTQMIAYMKEWTNTPSIYNQSGEMLNKTVTFFSFLERYADETDSSIKNRFRAIFERGGDSVWGTALNIKHVFNQYFPSGNIFVIENTNEDSKNLIADSDFQTPDETPWVLEDCEFSEDARFSKSYGIKFSSAIGNCSQVVTLNNTETDTTEKPYFLHWFMKGVVYVYVINADGEYWDAENKEWVITATNKRYETTEWDKADLYFKGAGEVTVMFAGTDDESYIDLISLYEKMEYGTFTVLAQFTGSSSKDAMALAEGDEDTEGEEWHEQASYYAPTNNEGVSGKAMDNYGYISGPVSGFAMDIYQDLLNLIKPVGVKAFIKIVNKDYKEGEE